MRIEAASVNPLDVKILAGYMRPIFPVAFPYAPGTDFSGVIESVGEQVSVLKTGDRVAGRTSPSMAVRSPPIWSSPPPNSVSFPHR
ncbi:alcohol dehydrogenase catalytic domain-containing protein [Pseudomonas corrugata]